MTLSLFLVPHDLRYDLRYQEVGEFIRCLKVSSKTSLDEIVVSLWNDVQQRIGKGLNTMSETGIVIERPVHSLSSLQCLSCQ